MSGITLGELVPLALQLEDGATGKFPQAVVLEEGGAGVAGSPFDLTHQGEGLYTSTALVMPNEPFLTATYIIYNEVGHSTESAIHLRASDVFTLVQEHATAANLALVETEAAADARETTNTAEHAATLAAVALVETEAAAATREATNTAEHGTTLAAVGLNESEAAAATREATNTAEHGIILTEVGLNESEAAAATREGTNTTEHAATLAAVGLNESEAAAAAREATNTAEHATTLAAIAVQAAIQTRILAFAAQDNVMLDGGPNATDATVPEYDSASLMLEGRMRAFDTPANRAAATPGNVAVEAGELFRQLISATSTVPGRADSYTSDRDL